MGNDIFFHAVLCESLIWWLLNSTSFVLIILPSPCNCTLHLASNWEFTIRDKICGWLLWCLSPSEHDVFQSLGVNSSKLDLSRVSNRSYNVNDDEWGIRSVSLFQLSDLMKIGTVAEGLAERVMFRELCAAALLTHSPGLRAIHLKHRWSWKQLFRITELGSPGADICV